MKNYFKTIKPFWPVALLFALSLFLLRSFFKAGFPETHDGQLYLARFANFFLAVQHHHFPIRWAPNLNYKFGYPVFLFNYYVPYILGLIPKSFGLDLEASFKVVIFFSLFIGGLFWYLLFNKVLSKRAGLAAGLIYIAAPYQMLDILVRCSIGEIVALGLLPFLFWSLYQLVTKPNRWHFFLTTLGLATFSLTHNIIFMFGFPVLFLYAVFLKINHQLTFKSFKPVVFSFLLAVGLTLFFWAPALMEKKYTNIDQLDQISFEYLNHFPTLKQLIYSPWGYGYSYLGDQDEMSFQIGPAQLIFSLVSIGWLLFDYKKTKKISFHWLFFAGLFVGSIIFLLPVSVPVWKILPFVNYVQFPWRLLTFTTIAAAGLAAFLTEKIPKASLILATISIIYVGFLSHPGGWFNHDDYFYYEFPFNTSIMDANTPKWFTLSLDQRENFGDRHVFDTSGLGIFRELLWLTQKHVYQVNTNQSTQIFERTVYFPGWQVKVDGLPTTINYQDDRYPGVISFFVEAGDHLIESTFTEITPARLLGDITSLVSLFCLTILLLNPKLLFYRS